MIRAFPWLKLTTAEVTRVLTRGGEALGRGGPARVARTAAGRCDPARLDRARLCDLLLGAGSGGDQKVEQRAVRAQALGVPLDAEDEPFAGVLDRFDRPVRCPGRGHEPVAERLNGLVVERVDLERRAAERGPEPAVRRGLDAVGGNARVLGLPMVDAGSDDIGKMLVERPPRATFSNCMPRQMARIGSLRRSAARTSASSTASTRGSVGPSSGWGSAP